MCGCSKGTCSPPASLTCEQAHTVRCGVRAVLVQSGEMLGVRACRRIRQAPCVGAPHLSLRNRFVGGCFVCGQRCRSAACVAVQRHAFHRQQTRQRLLSKVGAVLVLQFVAARRRTLRHACRAENTSRNARYRRVNRHRRYLSCVCRRLLGLVPVIASQFAQDLLGATRPSRRAAGVWSGPGALPSARRCRRGSSPCLRTHSRAPRARMLWGR